MSDRPADSEKSIFPLEISEGLILEATNSLRKKGLLPEPSLSRACVRARVGDQPAEHGHPADHDQPAEHGRLSAELEQLALPRPALGPRLR